MPIKVTRAFQAAPSHAGGCTPPPVKEKKKGKEKKETNEDLVDVEKERSNKGDHYSVSGELHIAASVLGEEDLVANGHSNGDSLAILWFVFFPTKIW